MKKILLGAAAVGLAGCNWGGSGYNHQYQYANHYGNYNGHSAHHQSAPHKMHGSHGFGNKSALELSIGAEQFTGGNITPMATIGAGQLNKIEYKDAYDTAWRATGGLSHNVAPRTTLLAQGFYKHADADDAVNLAQSGAGSVSGTFSDYKSYGAEVGFREYLSDHNARPMLRPYMGATVGAAYIESIDITYSAAPGAPVEVMDGDWVPTASAVIGIEMPVSRNFGLGVESGLRYEGKRDLNRDGLKSTDAYSVPLRLRGRFQF